MKRVRKELCERCEKETTVRYRVRAGGSAWQLVCPACTTQLKTTHPDYRYGGTWKARKRR